MTGERGAALLLSRLQRAARCGLEARGRSDPGKLCRARDLHVTAAAHQNPQAAPTDTIEVQVNGKAIQIPKGSTVMQACDTAGIDIPRYAALVAVGLEYVAGLSAQRHTDMSVL